MTTMKQMTQLNKDNLVWTHPKNLESWILWYIFLSPRGEHYLTRGDSNKNPIKIKYPEVCWVGSSLY